MLKSTVIFSFLVLVYITHYAESNPAPAPASGWPGLNFHFGFGGDSSGKSEGKSSGEIGGGGNGKSDGKSGGKFGGKFGGKSGGKSGGDIGGGGSGQSSGDIGGSAQFSLGSMMESIIALPIKLPVKIAKVPIKLSKKTITLVLAAIKEGMQVGMSGLSKIGSLNAEAVSGAMDISKTVLGKFVRGLANTNIFGIEVGYDVGGWFAGSVSEAVDGGLKLMTWSLAKVGKVADGSIRTMHVKEILQLPVLKQIVGLCKNINHWNKDQIMKNYVELGKFIDSIIYQHKDFFIPIFHKIINIFLAFTKAMQIINDGGKYTGIAATLEKLKASLEPIMSSNWPTFGLGGKAGSSGKEGGIVLGGTVSGEAEEPCDDESSKGGSGKSHSSSGGSAGMGQGTLGGGKSSAEGKGHGASKDDGGMGSSAWDEWSKGMDGSKGSHDDSGHESDEPCNEDGKGESSDKHDGKGSTKG